MVVKEEGTPMFGHRRQSTELTFRFMNCEMSMGYPSGNVQQVWFLIWESPACFVKWSPKSGWNCPGNVQRMPRPCFSLEHGSLGTEHGGKHWQCHFVLDSGAHSVLFPDSTNCHLLLLQSHQYLMILSSFQADTDTRRLLDSLNRCLDLNISHAHTPKCNEMKEKPFHCMLMPPRQLLQWQFLALLLDVKAVILLLILFLDYQNKILKPLSLVLVSTEQSIYLFIPDHLWIVMNVYRNGGGERWGSQNLVF